MSEASENTPITAGGAGKLASIDPSNPKDIATVRNAVRNWPRRWAGITPEAKAEFVEGMREAQAAARRIVKDAETSEEALKAAGVISNLARTAAALEDQVQKDEHLADKNARLDAGQATERIAMEPVTLRKPI